MLLEHSVGRVLRKAARLGEFAEPSPDDLRHIADWLLASVTNEAGWLGNLDGQSRPKKLMKFSTIADIVAEADKAMLRASAVGSKGTYRSDADDERHVRSFANGYYLVELASSEALDRESGQMQHCIGNGAYDRHLMTGRRRFLSLRDPQGRAHATMEIEVHTHRLLQAQGKQNRKPMQKYADMLAEYLCDEGIDVSRSAALLGYVIDFKTDWHRIDNLPESLAVSGDLDLSGSEIRRLPDNLFVSGNLRVSDTAITEFPRNAHIQKSISLARTAITEIHNLSTVHGDLDLSGSAIRVLPDGLVVEGKLDVSNSDIEVLPANLHVRHTLAVNNTVVSEIPDDTYVGVRLEIRRTSIEHLPDSLDDDLVVEHGWFMSGKKTGMFSRWPTDGDLAETLKRKPSPPSIMSRMASAFR